MKDVDSMIAGYFQRSAQSALRSDWLLIYMHVLSDVMLETLVSNCYSHPESTLLYTISAGFTSSYFPHLILSMLQLSFDDYTVKAIA